MAFQALAIITVLGTSASAATSIANTVNQFEQANSNSVREDDRRGTLVVIFAQNLLTQVRRYSRKNIGAVVVVKSTLNYTLTGSYKRRLGSTKIGGWGYSVYVVTKGELINNDPNSRGFHNWTVVGNNHQYDNVIEIYQE